MPIASVENKQPFLERFKGKTSIISKNGINELFKTNKRNFASQSPHRKSMETIENVHHPNSKVIMQQNASVLPCSYSRMTKDKSTTSSFIVNPQRRSSIGKGVKQKSGDTSLYVSSVYKLPNIESKFGSVIPKKLGTRMQFNDAVHSQAKKSISYYQKFNLNKDALDRVKILDQLNLKSAINKGSFKVVTR